MTYIQQTLPISWSLSYKLEEFVVTECNRYAFEWLSKWPFKIHENFACIIGDKGAGKTNLAMIWAKRLNADILNAGNINEKWLNIFSQNKYFVIDDADLVSDDILLFFIYNSIRENNAYLLLTAKIPPIKWDIKLEDVRSRLFTISTIHIQKPNEEALSKIIKQMLKQRGLEINEQAINYIVNNMERSYESANFIVNKIDTNIKKKNKITLNFIKNLM